MKRNFLTLSLAALIGATTLLPAAASGAFERTGKTGEGMKKEAVTKQKANPLTQRRKAVDAAKRNPLLGAPSGYLTIRPYVETQRPANHMTRSIEAPRGNIIGNVCDFSGMTTYTQAFMGNLDLATGKVKRMFTTQAIINGNDYDFQGGALRKGVFYTPVSLAAADGGTLIRWNAVDIETGDVLTPVNFGPDVWSAYAYSMTYDEKEDLFYCLAVDGTLGQSNIFSVIDPKKNFEVTYSRSLNTGGAFLGAIAYCPADEQIYVFNDQGGIYTVTPGSNRLTEAGVFANEECPVTTNATLPVTYSPRDEAFVFQIIDNYNNQLRLGFFDIYDWEIIDRDIVLGGDVEGPYFASFCSLDAFADNDAPELPSMPVVTFDKASLSGTVTFSAPKMNYAGIEIASGDKIATVVKIDGNEVFNQELAPGEEKTIQSTLEQGMHVMSVVCSHNGKESPMRSARWYVGNDTPLSPKGLKLEGTHLSWEPVTSESGVNRGYVDTAAITYNVYFDGIKMNQEPLTGTSFDFEMPAQLHYTTITVTATANGMTSEKATIGEVIGHALDLPQSLEPTVEQADLFQVLNPGNDDVRFGLAPIDFDMGRPVFMCRTDFYTGANDWLFMPLMNFPDTSHLYNLSFMCAETMYEGQENLDVYITDKVTTDTSDMRSLYSARGEDYGMGRNISTNFSIPKAGEYYIAFHLTSAAAISSGVSLYDFSVNGIKMSSDVPADPEVTITPGAFGALNATVAMTAPTLNTIGAPLDTSKEITIEVVCGGRTLQANAKPGESVTVEMPVSENGFSTFEITPSNGNGKGLTRSYRRYVGLDTPMAPQNIKGVPTSDNLGLTLTWDKPSNVGAHGGYVDADKVDYRIYNVVGVTYYPIAETKELRYEFRPLESLPNAQALDRYITGPSAFNKVGESSQSLFIQDVLGTPNLLPMKEEFNGILYTPLYFNESGESNQTAFTNITTIMADIFKHNCDQDLISGGLQFYSTSSRPVKAELFLPKFSTKNEKKVDFGLRYLDYTYAPVMHIWGRCDGQNEPVLLGDIVPSKPEKGEWKDVTIALPENFIGKGWVQIIFRADLTSHHDEYGFIDSYTVSNNADVDIAVRQITGPAQIFTGEKADYQITAVNGGKERVQGNLKLDLIGKDGRFLRHEEKRLPRLAPMGTASTILNLEMLEEYAELSPLTLRATTDLEGDEVEWNNTYEYTIEVRDHQAPVVRDLKGEWNDGETSVSLSWSEPSTTIGNLEAFELLNAFSCDEQLGIWKNYDLDGAPVFGFSGLETLWPGMLDTKGWEVIDVNQLLPFKGDSRMGAHSGSKYIMARTPSFDTEDPSTSIQANDWLVSPQVVGGSELTFWYGTPDSSLTEYIELWCSSTDDEVGPEIIFADPNTSVGATCGSFKYVRTFSKEGADAWEKVTVDLPADAKYFALVYRTPDGFGAMVDDIEFVQADPANYEIDHYAVYRILDGDWTTFTFLGDTKTPSYVDNSVDNSHNPTYFVTTYVKSDNGLFGGPRSNYYTVNTLGIGDIANSKAVAGSKGIILINGYEGSNAKVYTTDGKLVRDLNVKDSTEVLHIEAGIYMVVIGKESHKVLVK